MISCTVLILTYKGKHHLEYLLPTVREAISNSPNYLIDVLIIDNGRDALTKDFVNQNYPEYSFKFSPSNDYLFSLNHFISDLRSEYVLILNDDLKLDIEVFNQSVPFLVNDLDLFAITAKIYNWDGNGTQNGVRIYSNNKGWATSYWNFDFAEQLRYTFYASGGAGLFRVSYFNDLQGFDPIFRPAYIEEVDLSHRAWKNGWKVIYNPKFIVYHRDAGTISLQFKSDTIAQFFYKNFFLWQYKNINNISFKFAFLIRLPFRLVYWRYKSPNHLKGFFMAFKEIPKIPVQRRSKVSEESIISTIGKEYDFQR